MRSTKPSPSTLQCQLFSIHHKYTGLLYALLSWDIRTYSRLHKTYLYVHDLHVYIRAFDHRTHSLISILPPFQPHDKPHYQYISVSLGTEDLVQNSQHMGKFIHKYKSAMPRLCLGMIMCGGRVHLYIRGIHGLKSNRPNRANRPFLANQSREPTKFLSCVSLSALLTKERLAIWCPC